MSFIDFEPRAARAVAAWWLASAVFVAGCETNAAGSDGPAVMGATAAGHSVSSGAAGSKQAGGSAASKAGAGARAGAGTSGAKSAAGSGGATAVAKDAGAPSDSAVDMPAPNDSGTGGGGSGGSRGDRDAGAAEDAAVQPPNNPDFTYLSDTDRDEQVSLSSDRLAAEWLGSGTWGVRSTRSIRSGSGVFYVEATTAPDVDYFDLGVATAAAPLGMPAGASAAGFSVNVEGYYLEGGSVSEFMPASGATYGFVVDYRASHPTIYLLGGAAKPGALIATETLDTVGEPVFIHLSGVRRVAGLQVGINPGNDTTNRPFVLDPSAVLKASGKNDVADALVLGWGASHQSKLNAEPTLDVATKDVAPIALGGSVTLTAAAMDSEDGDLTGKIDWEVLSEGNGPERVHGSGGTFTFTPKLIGRHPIQVSVVDSGGKSARAAAPIVVTVTGTLEQFSEVRLVPEPELSGDGIMLDQAGLQARWTVDHKLGVRANQGLYGDFQYVEAHRLVPPWNQAIGLVIGGVTLNPYAFDTAPPSCSVNTWDPTVTIWQNLILQNATEISSSSTEYYGLAVDYRGASPIVYVIMGGKLVQTLELRDVTVPLYPMLYGNVTPSGAEWTAPYDMAINFGATAFHEDPAAALTAAGVSSSGLKLCWGTANAACAKP